MNGMIILNHHCSTYNPTDGRIVDVICGRGPFNGFRKRGAMIGACRIVQRSSGMAAKIKIRPKAAIKY